MFTYQTTHVESGKMVIDSTKQIDQSKMTSDCFLVQLSGLSACEACKVKNTAECGGGATLARLQS